MSEDFLIQASGIHKAYRIAERTIPVLKGVSLDVRRGETVSIMGASGAGKTTLLYILGGLDVPTKGEVRLDGKDLFRMPGPRRDQVRASRLGYVFQAYYLLPELDVLENVMLPSMAVRGARGARERARELLAKVGLDHRADHRPMELSGGEQQRAALARALMNDPDILMADEPTGNLDSNTGSQVLEYLFGLVAERGHSLVLVSHNEDVARRCDRVLHLDDGALG